ncbi:MAG TPA: transposase [Chloroflexota bacterium]|nr:transposase [Chloroflexota bacterium]
MIDQSEPLVVLLSLVDGLAWPVPAPRRARPDVYADHLILKGLVVMLVHRVWQAHGLLAILSEPSPQTARVRAQLTDERGRFPRRRTWERRLNRLAGVQPLLIAVLGTWLLRRVDPWPHGSRAVAIDSTCLRARGGVWHKKHREAGEVPHTSIDTEAAWTKSGWHGWVYGGKLHVVVTVSDTVWLPLAADLTPANVADNEQATRLLVDLPEEISAVLGDMHYNDPTLHTLVTSAGRLLITTKRGAYPHTDDGVEVRRLFHQLRSHAVENFNAPFKTIFGCLGNGTTRGLISTRLFALGGVLLYQLTLWHHALANRDLRQGLKPFLLSA